MSRNCKGIFFVFFLLTCYGCHGGCPNDALVDLVIILDSSSSLGDMNWHMVLDFIISLVGRLRVGADATNVGVFRYHRSVDTASQILLQDFADNATALAAAIHDISYNGRGTHTGGALQHARTVLFKAENGDRAEASNVILLVTDGNAQDPNLVFEESRELQASRIRVYAIEIENSDQESTQLPLITRSQERVISKKITELNSTKLAEEMVSRLYEIRGCRVAPPVCVANESNVEEVVAAHLTAIEGNLQRNAAAVFDELDAMGSFDRPHISIRRELVHLTTPGRSFSFPGSDVIVHPPSFDNQLLVQVSQFTFPRGPNFTCTFFEMRKPKRYPLEKTFGVFPDNFLSAFGLLDGNGTELSLGVRWDSNETYAKANRSMFAPAVPLEGVLITGLQHDCSFVDVDANLFSFTGCRRLPQDNASRVSCTCNHTTTFATLLAVSVVRVPESVKVLSYVMELLSVICLCMTLFVLLVVRKKIAYDRVFIQINLTISLLLLHLSNLFHDVALQSDSACAAIAVVIHYFMLATGTWMVVEGVGLFLKTSEDALSYTGRKASSIRRLSLALGWLFPAVVVAVAASIGFSKGVYIDANEAYPSAGEFARSFRVPVVHRYNQCWLSAESGVRVYALIIPVALCVFINLYISAKVATFVSRMSAKLKQPDFNRKDAMTSQFKAMKAGLRAIVIMFPALGIPWILGFFVGVGGYTTTLALLHLNAIVNGLQGVSLFTVYCVVNREVKSALLVACVPSRARKAGTN